MMPLSGLFFITLISICSAANSDWRLVRLPSGSWMAVLEMEAGSRFLLHPEAVLIRANLTKTCNDDAISTVEIRFWTSNQLLLTQRSMLRQGFCRSPLRCKLEPFHARTVVLRDQLDMWKSVRPQRFVPIALPPVLTFEMRRKTTKRNCEAATVRHLRGLVIEIAGGIMGRSPERLSLSASGLTERNSSKQAVTKPATVSPLPGKKPVVEVTFNRTHEGIPIVTDCSQVKQHRFPAGKYFLEPFNRYVHCTTAGEVLILRRTRSKLDFNRNWVTYKRGFGDIAAGDFFLGMDFLSKYTAVEGRCMRLILRDMNPTTPVRVAEYSDFRVLPEVTNFKLEVNKYRGTMLRDPFRNHKNSIFSTADRNNKHNCARRYKGPNWFIKCHHIHLFGIYNGSSTDFSSVGMTSSGHSKLKSAYMSLRSVRRDPRDMIQVYSVQTPSCPSRVKQWLVPATGEYRITVGGAAGGTSPHINYMSGGRGAIASGLISLNKGTKLGLVIGCQGSTGDFSGFGGDASVVAIRGINVMLLVAGGGGGAGWSDGLPGRKSPEGGQPNLAPGVPNNVTRTAAHSWLSLRALIFGPLNRVASSGGATWSARFSHSRGGGGGGGYRGGWAAEDAAMDAEWTRPLHSAGGGGGSACKSALMTSCKTEEGGNPRQNGFILIETYRCF